MNRTSSDKYYDLDDAQSQAMFVARKADVDAQRFALLPGVVADLLSEKNPSTGKPYTQKELAKRLGVSQALISGVKNADFHGVGLKLLLALREATGRSLDELLSLPSTQSSVAMPRDIADALREIISRKPLQ